MEKNALKQLKDILLEDERDKQSDLQQQIAQLRAALESGEVAAQLKPAVEEQVRTEMSKTPISETIIRREVKTELKNSQSELLDAMYPVMGQMIKKYLQMEMERLAENIEKQIDNTFSWESIKREFLSFFGISQRAMLLKQANEVKIEEVFLIFKDSGIVMGHYSQEQTVDSDMIAGMLTAIKAFVEDAFQQKGGTLDTIDYGTLKIILHPAHSYYMATVLSGVVDTDFRVKLLDFMAIFSQKYLQAESLDADQISEFLKQEFDNFHNFNPLTKRIDEFTNKQKSYLDW